MPQSPEDITAQIAELTRPGFRGSLISRGLARGLIWRDGNLPPESPQFAPSLSTDLLDHGFQCLSLALRLREVEGDPTAVNASLYAAAESIESAVRHGSPRDDERAFHLTMAAAAFHIGGYSARAFSLFSLDLAVLNLSSCERLLVNLMRRDMDALHRTTREWLQAPGNADEGVVAKLAEDEDFGISDVIAIGLTRVFHEAFAHINAALSTGDDRHVTEASRLLDTGLEAAAEAAHVPLWWSFAVARHLFDDMWRNSMHVIVPMPQDPPTWGMLRSKFIQLLGARHPSEVDLWPSQRDAARRVMDTSDDLVVALPTSAGKTRIAELCILRALADGSRVVYVTPLRALSAQIERTLARTFRPLGYTVTSVYGASGVAVADLDTMKSASIVVATPEKLDFSVRLDPSVIDDVGLIVLDEGHMIGLGEREIRYEMLVQRLLRRADTASRRLVCLSAVFTEGDAFDDFTRWLRSDTPGLPVRSTWRPTRQRPGVLVWKSPSARLELQVDAERPFVPRFVEAQPAVPPRRTPFPNTSQEFVVATTTAFLNRGQTVLVYCPLRKSVEATAKAFLKAHQQGYFPGLLTGPALAQVERALLLGEEWLGTEHPAVACLRLGVAVHHGSLPRQFLSEVENLLKQRVLPVCVSSPTLAQGLDLCFSVLLFRSLYRTKRLIPPKEFANVIGRVGRAFVDLDGLYVLPVYEESPTKARERVREFSELITGAKTRQLESGVRQLIGLILRILRERLLVSDTDLKEYVLNQASTWVAPTVGTDDPFPALLDSALNELDAAILGVVDSLDLPTEELANVLDAALRSSYWQRRLAHDSDESRALQEAVIRGRASWIWARTDTTKRKQYYAAGVGVAAGQALDANGPFFRERLSEADAALLEGRTGDLITSLVEIAKTVFAIGPFAAENLIPDWEALLGHWISGTALSQCADSDGVAFIQEDVVFRLVWGVEAVRLHLQSTDSLQDVSGEGLALCLTYGVPTLGASAFMQAGVRSRVFAQAVSARAGPSVTTQDDVRLWVFTITQGGSPAITWSTDAEESEWQNFLQRFGHRDYADWQVFQRSLPVAWSGEAPQAGTRVRVIRDRDESVATVMTLMFEPIGQLRVPDDIESLHFFALVDGARSSVDINFFGQFKYPTYLQ